MPDDRIEIVTAEAEAIARGIAMLSEDSLLVVLADKVPEALSVVSEYALHQRPANVNG